MCKTKSRLIINEAAFLYTIYNENYFLKKQGIKELS